LIAKVPKTLGAACPLYPRYDYVAFPKSLLTVTYNIRRFFNGNALYCIISHLAK